MLNTQSRNVDKSIKTMRTADLVVPREVEEEIQRIAPGVPEGEIVGQFRQICEKLDVLDLYVVYGVESTFVHPSIPTINAYCDNYGVLQTTPQRALHRGNFALLAPCLIWAGRDLDSLTEGQPAAEGLERLATAIGCQPALPPYPAESSRTAELPGGESDGNADGNDGNQRLPSVPTCHPLSRENTPGPGYPLHLVSGR
jgi:hypothetical protein